MNDDVYLDIKQTMRLVSNLISDQMDYIPQDDIYKIVRVHLWAANLHILHGMYILNNIMITGEHPKDEDVTKIRKEFLDTCGCDHHKVEK